MYIQVWLNAFYALFVESSCHTVRAHLRAIMYMYSLSMMGYWFRLWCGYNIANRKLVAVCSPVLVSHSDTPHFANQCFDHLENPSTLSRGVVKALYIVLEHNIHNDGHGSFVNYCLITDWLLFFLSCCFSNQMTCWLSYGTGKRSGYAVKFLKDTPTMWCRLSLTPRIITSLLVLPWIELSRYDCDTCCICINYSQNKISLHQVIGKLHDCTMYMYTITPRSHQWSWCITSFTLSVNSPLQIHVSRTISKC